MAITISPKDSMEVIQNKLKSGGDITMKQGIYKITKPLFLYSNTILNLDNVIIKQGSRIHNMFITYTTPNTTGYSGVINLTINGHGDSVIEGMQSKYDTSLNLLTLWHSNNVAINNVIFKDVCRFHSLEINGSANVTIKDCKFYGYVADEKNNIREFSQIDFSSESAVFLHKSGSKCYDGTPCKNITYINCEFGRSSSRISAPYCIGNHCQSSGLKHKNITIRGCKFYGDRANKNGCAIHLIGMENVLIEDCYSEDFARFVYISNLTQSYNARGKKVVAKDEDGICMNVTVSENTIKPLGTFRVVDVFAASRTKGKHKNIVKSNNKIIDK